VRPLVSPARSSRKLGVVPGPGSSISLDAAGTGSSLPITRLVKRGFAFACSMARAPAVASSAPGPYPSGGLRRWRRKTLVVDLTRGFRRYGLGRALNLAWTITTPPPVCFTDQVNARQRATRSGARSTPTRFPWPPGATSFLISECRDGRGLGACSLRTGQWAPLWFPSAPSGFP
jgi:hypothetical protein